MAFNDRFLRACRREPVDRTPVWIMRQAGRYLPEYRAVRAGIPFLTLCKTPEKAAEVTLQPIDILGVDAAILFSDILIPLEPLGIGVRFDEGGPVLEPPELSLAAIERLGIPDPTETVPFVLETIRILRRELAGRVPLIGFAGAPFTLASYVVERGGSKDFLTLKRLCFESPRVAHALLGKLADTVGAYLAAQIEAGAQAVQIFDTWAGILSPRDYDEFAGPYVRRVIEALPNPGVPVIHYVNGGAALLERMRAAGGDVIGIDWKQSLASARARLGTDVAVQGNLDPVALFLPEPKLEQRVREILDEAGPAPGHVFNLGHGIFPQTAPERARFLVDCVHRLSEKPQR